MDDKDSIKLENKTSFKESKTLKNNCQTNPIIQKMLACDEASKKMKFKFKDLFR